MEGDHPRIGFGASAEVWAGEASARNESTQQPVPIDVFGSLRSTALVTLVAASFTSPIIVKSDAFANASARLGSISSKQAPEQTEQLVAGGVQFALPDSWDRLGASAVGGSTAANRIGTVVSGICPGGSAGGDCSGGAKITFIAYSGREGHKLPMLTTFESQLDDKLPAEYRNFAKGDSKLRPGADGIRYLDYPFTWGAGRDGHAQRIAAFRHADGSGVVLLATGDQLAKNAAAIDAFLASAHEPELEPGAAE